MSRDIELIYKLDGESIDKTGINVQALAPILLSLGALIEEANNIIYPSGPKLSIHVKPFKKGSFVVDISIFRNSWEALTSLINNHDIETTKQILEWIGIIGSGSIPSLIILLKFLNGSPSKTETIDKDQVRYTNEYGHSITVNVNVQKLYNSGFIHTNLQQSILDPLENKEIDRIETYLKSNESETKSEFSKEDVKQIENSLFRGEEVTHDDDEAVNEQIVYLNPKKIDLEGDGRSWVFRKAGSRDEKIRATIKDEDFLKKQNFLKKDDLLKVKMITKQKIQNGRITYSNEIIKIEEYTPAPEQGEFGF